MERREPSCTVGGNINWYSHYGRRYVPSLKKWGIKPPYDPVIPLLSIYIEETKTEKDTCTPMFIAALLIIARTWNQPRCPLTDEWIKKLWYLYTMKYYSAIKRSTFESFLMRWMNLERIIHSSVDRHLGCFHVTLSIYLTLSSPFPMSVSLFSMSVSPLLPCK